MLPRIQAGRDDKNPNRLLLRYGDDVVATLEVQGKAASVDDIQLRDRTGARNMGQRIDTIDLDIVHPPGVMIRLEVSRSSLANTTKPFGIIDVKVRPIEAQLP